MQMTIQDSFTPAIKYLAPNLTLLQLWEKNMTSKLVMYPVFVSDSAVFSC